MLIGLTAYNHRITSYNVCYTKLLRKTNGTTLGGDDGIGIAAAMAVLTSTEIEHPKIEALFTVDEETGMTGAFGIKDGFLEGTVLINLDSEDEGELFIGSAGGMDTTAIFEYNKEPVDDHTLRKCVHDFHRVILGFARITSYNVCYTKLLRIPCRAWNLP